QSPVPTAQCAPLISFAPAQSSAPAYPTRNSVAEISTERIRAMGLAFPKPATLAARPVAHQPHVSVGDYTTQAQVGFSSLPEISIPTEGDTAVVLSADEAALLSDLNQERTSRGLNALDIDPRLVLIAREHSE